MLRGEGEQMHMLGWDGALAGFPIGTDPQQGFNAIDRGFGQLETSTLNWL